MSKRYWEPRTGRHGIVAVDLWQSHRSIMDASY